MENDQAFEADADVNALERLNSRSHQRSSHKGQEALEAAFGRFTSRDDIDGEDTPLLRRNDGEEAENDGPFEHGEGNERGPPTWDGERDFEGLPWWNKPSVRKPALRIGILLILTLSRFSGSSLLSHSSQWLLAAPSFHGSTSSLTSSVASTLRTDHYMTQPSI